MKLYATIEDGENTERVRLNIADLDHVMHASGEVYLDAFEIEIEGGPCKVQKKRLSNFTIAPD